MNTSEYTNSRICIGKGIAVGVLGGLVGAWTMNAFQSFLSEIRKRKSESQKSPEHGDSNQQEASASEDPATVNVARSASRDLLDHELQDDEKAIAGNMVHYAMGAGSGAIYGAIAGVLPAATLGRGLLFGTVLWLTADEGIVPALGFSKSPWEYPASTHVSAWTSHLVYGLTVDTVRRVALRLI